MGEEHRDENRRADAMNDGHHLRAAEQPDHHRRPGAVGIEHRHSRQDQRHGAQQHEKMGDPPDDGEALEPSLVLGFILMRRRIDVAVLRRAARLALLVRAVEPQRGMGPKEREHARQQRRHAFRGKPQIGIVLEIVGIAVRLESGEAGAGVGVALLTRSEPVGREHGRTVVVDPLDRMAAMAVEALGGIGVAQGVDLPVIGVQIGFQLFLMARAAVLGDDQLGRVQQRVFNVVTGVAVRAGRRRGIMVLQHQLAMNRVCIGRKFFGMARAAGVGQVQPPSLPGGGPRRIDVVRVMAIVAGRIGFRLVGQRRPRMNRIHELADLLDDEAQSGEFFCLSFYLGFFPQVLVATDAADRDLRRRVGDRRYVRVALDALASAVDARLEFLLVHEQRARFSRPAQQPQTPACHDKTGTFHSVFSRRAAKSADRPRRRYRPLAPLRGSGSRPRRERRRGETPRLAGDRRSETSPAGRAPAPAPMPRRDGPRPRTPWTRRSMRRARTASGLAPLAPGRNTPVERDYSAAQPNRHAPPALRLVEASAERNVGLQGVVFAHGGAP